MARETRTYLRAYVLSIVLAGCADVLSLDRPTPIPSFCVSDRDCPPDYACSNSQCKSNTCPTPGEKQCNGLQRLRCGNDHKWKEEEKCPSKCEADGCVEASSCKRLDACGTLSCCDSIQIAQDSFQLYFATPEQIDGQSDFPVRHVSRSIRPFMLDRFEVTVGRFKAFVAEYEAARYPLPGAGKHPAFADSGWQERWNEPNGPLPQMVEDLVRTLRARGERLSPDDDPRLPVRGVSWHLAAAFCIWDGGRLPTEAEWLYAATGGEDRLFPWPGEADPAITPERAVYTGDGVMPDGPAPVGGHPQGRGPFEHEDLAGNVQEWVADVYTSTLPSTCHGPGDATIDEFECLQRGSDDDDRVLHGGAYQNTPYELRNARRVFTSPYAAERDFGIRCARDLPANP